MQTVSLALPHFNPQTCLALKSLPSLFSYNPVLGHPVVVQLLGGQQQRQDGHHYGSSGLSSPLPSGDSAANVLKVLRTLPPTLPIFDVLGRLLRDPTVIPMPSEIPESTSSHSIGGTSASTRSNISGANWNGLGINMSSPLAREATAKTTVADLIRTEVLGGFVQHAIDWINTAEQHMQEGLISDDRAEKAVQSVSLRPLFFFF